MTTDKQGREYAKLSELKAGDTVTVDGDFTCMKAWSQHIVKASLEGLFIPYKEGEHMLDGQADDGGNLVGIYPGVVKP